MKTKELITEEEKLKADIIIFTLRCSACNKTFKAIATPQIYGRKVKECPCGAGYIFYRGEWIWKYNKKLDDK